MSLSKLSTGDLSKLARSSPNYPVRAFNVKIRDFSQPRVINVATSLSGLEVPVGSDSLAELRDIFEKDGGAWFEQKSLHSCNGEDSKKAFLVLNARSLAESIAKTDFNEELKQSFDFLFSAIDKLIGLARDLNSVFKPGLKILDSGKPVNPSVQKNQDFHDAELARVGYSTAYSLYNWLNELVTQLGGLAEPNETSKAAAQYLKDGLIADTEIRSEYIKEPWKTSRSNAVSVAHGRSNALIDFFALAD